MYKYLVVIIFNLAVAHAYGQFNQKKFGLAPNSDTTRYQPPRIKPAEFPKGMGGFYKLIGKKMRYPKEAKKANIKGKVFVQFIIDTTGMIKKESIKVVGSLCESCDREAIRVIQKMPRWIPAIDLDRNKKIECPYTVPIFFL